MNTLYSKSEAATHESSTHDRGRRNQIFYLSNCRYNENPLQLVKRVLITGNFDSNTNKWDKNRINSTERRECGKFEQLTREIGTRPEEKQFP